MVTMDALELWHAPSPSGGKREGDEKEREGEIDLIVSILYNGDLSSIGIFGLCDGCLLSSLCILHDTDSQCGNSVQRLTDQKTDQSEK